MIIETGTISFSNANTGSHNFTKVFTSAPYVTAIAFDSASNNQANINVFITAVSTTSFAIETSANFTGEVHFQAIQVLA